MDPQQAVITNLQAAPTLSNTSFTNQHGRNTASLLTAASSIPTAAASGEWHGRGHNAGSV